MRRDVGLERFGLLLALFAGSAVAVTPAAAPAPAPPPEVRGKYTGYGSCSSPLCHGDVKSRPLPGIRHDEVSLWVKEDAHSRAFEALASPLAARMARILGLGEAATADRCLDCHTLHVPPELRGRTFDAREAVSCESCHGPAAGWLGPHTTTDWTHAQSLERGMIDTKDPVVRVQRCLACHLGSADRTVDHELIAAGHPALRFELETSTERMPRHWRTAPAGGTSLRARDWAVGQAVQLAASLEQLARRARSAGSSWPEYAELRCEACHHALTPPDKSWRQESGYAGRRAGVPPWDPSRWTVFGRALLALDPALHRDLDAGMAELASEMSRLAADREKIGARASALAERIERLAAELARREFDRALVAGLLQKITDAPDELAAAGAAAAGMAAASIEALLDAYAELRAANPEGGRIERERERGLRESLTQLSRTTESPSTWEPERFSSAMQHTRELLGGTIR